MKALLIVLVSLALGSVDAGDDVWISGPPATVFSVTDISFTTGGGAKISASADGFGHLTSLKVRKNGWVYTAPREILKRIGDADISDLIPYEESDAVYLKLRADVFGPNPYHEGDLIYVGYTIWELRIVGGKLEKIEHDETLRPFMSEWWRE